jgi:hypothetical protein
MDKTTLSSTYCAYMYRLSGDISYFPHCYQDYRSGLWSETSSVASLIKSSEAQVEQRIVSGEQMI